MSIREFKCASSPYIMRHTYWTLLNKEQSLIRIEIKKHWNSFPRSDFWSRRFLRENVKEIKPTTWWSGLCASTALSKAPCTSAAVGQSFSTHSHIQNKKRNRLPSERAAKIAFISYNWNLLNKSDLEKDDDYEECMCVTPPTIGTHEHQMGSSMDTFDSPQPSTSGTATIE
ncbi:unnamed protein product [Parnassius apollo]|uniref:(apollo) hypothetical protein n=1 Tax=Parnassius apollo TaxID=110799 RepID=A0A8S3XVM1_PARAO|nr:unnamed protein product [Parnassius apollo]